MSALGVERVCCMLHSLDPGGSTWQWLRLLGLQVETGGRATVLAPPGDLATIAEGAGIEVIPTVWAEEEARSWVTVKEAAGRSDLAIVHWDHAVMNAFWPALGACGRAGLAIHQMPTQIARWHGPESLAAARALLEGALAEPDAFVLVRGAAHRARFEEAFGLPGRELGILPVSVPLPDFRPADARDEVLAMVRHSPEKAAVTGVAIELTREGLARGRDTRLAVAGEGPTRGRVEALCAERLPDGAWRPEGAPADPIERLAASDLVVAQGSTTLEAAALGRRVVVARATGGEGAACVVLRAENYEEAALDPFGRPTLSDDLGAIWEEVEEVDTGELIAIRRLVERRNSLGAAAAALREAVGPVGAR